MWGGFIMFSQDPFGQVEVIDNYQLRRGKRELTQSAMNNTLVGTTAAKGGPLWNDTG